jgi:hypothetical protein
MLHFKENKVMKTKTIMYVVGFVIVLGVLFSWNRIFPSKGPAPIADPGSLASIQTTDAPWPPELAHLAQRLRAIGLQPLSSEGAAMHIHQHLDIFIDGKPVPVSANVGINQAGGFISDIHVHDNTGVIHVEAAKVQTFTLGQFFDIWGVKFTQDSIGGYTATGGKTLKIYSNGTLYQGDPRALTLQAHQEIAVVYGTDKDAPQSIPSSYAFPPGE